MNFLTTREHDQFSEKTITKTIPFEWAFANVIFQHVSNPEGERLTIELYREDEYMFLEKGGLVININKSKNIKLKPFDVSRKQKNGTDRESASYELSKEQLLQICNAKTVDYKLSGDHVSENSVDYYDEDDEIEIFMDGDEVNIDGIMCDLGLCTIDKIQYGAQALYNAIYDSSAFTQELNQLKNSILQEEKERKDAKQKKEDSAKKGKSGCLSTIILLLTPAILGVGYAIYSIFA